MAYQVSMLSCTITLLYGTSARRTADKVSVARIKEAAVWQPSPALTVREMHTVRWPLRSKGFQENFSPPQIL